MGVLNFLLDSFYWEMVCYMFEVVFYWGWWMIFEGVVMVDIGVEFMGEMVDIVLIECQIDWMCLVVSVFVVENILVLVEMYYLEVGIVFLEVGVVVINLMGWVDDVVFYQMIVCYEVGIVLCYMFGDNVWLSDYLLLVDQVFDVQLVFFRDWVVMVINVGIECFWVDFGFGFVLNLFDGLDCIWYQIDSILQLFCLCELGWLVIV